MSVVANAVSPSTKKQLKLAFLANPQSPSPNLAVLLAVFLPPMFTNAASTRGPNGGRSVAMGDDPRFENTYKPKYARVHGLFIGMAQQAIIATSSGIEILGA